jgi:methylated-DNA-[protein]-cysteine S-methyltransferase
MPRPSPPARTRPPAPARAGERAPAATAPQRRLHARLKRRQRRHLVGALLRGPLVDAAIGQLTRYFEGKAEELSGIPLDLSSTPPFHRKVYEALRGLRRGKVCTYGELAALAGSPLASRAVGQALAKNPLPILIPCHRVVASGGRPGGFSASGGLDTKARLLALEGAALAR